MMGECCMCALATYFATSTSAAPPVTSFRLGAVGRLRSTTGFELNRTATGAHRTWGGAPSAGRAFRNRQLPPPPHPFLLEIGNAEVPIIFPSFRSHPAAVKQHANKGVPPPPPRGPESFWGSGEGRASWAPRTRPSAEGLIEPQERSTHFGFTGTRIVGASQGPR